MKVQTAAPLLVLLAISCRSSQTTELRPAVQTTPAVATAPVSPAPAQTSAPADASSPRTLIAPGATGQLTSSLDSNHNLVLKVELEHLPPPSDLDAALTTYVVWLRPRSGGAFQNVGQLIMDSDREGELTATTPYSDVDVMVTAEASATPRDPSRFIVLQGTPSHR